MPITLRYLISLIVIVTDQITKITAENAIELYEQIVVLPVFNLTLAYNPGAAFSFLANAGGWQRYFFTGISLIVSICLIVWLAKLEKSERLMTWSFALILGGAIGNLIDRIAYGHVIDFLQVHWNEAYFPSFNFADVGICIGAILMLIATFLDGRNGDRTINGESSGH